MESPIQTTTSGLLQHESGPSCACRQLGSNQAVLLCPGGVRECTYMQKGREVAFLSERTGFVRIALQHGRISLGCTFRV
jgi:hypothetical protein